MQGRFVASISGGRSTGTGGRHQTRPVLRTACILLRIARSCLIKDVVAATRFLTEMTTEQLVFLPIAA
jgi:hypothetical protein